MTALAVDRIAGPAASREVAFLHGILGRGQNLRAVARRLVAARPEIAALLVDLRGHGASAKGTPGPTLAAAAADVLETAPALAAVVGHSFGGKVALEMLRQAPLGVVVTLDSLPGARPPVRGGDAALDVIDDLAALPATFASRADLVAALVARGRSRAIAEWLAQSVAPDAGGVRFALDLDEVRSLVLDYFARDLWGVVEDPPGGARVHLVIGERSTSYGPADRARAQAIAARSDRVTVELLPADHWVHVDDPDGVHRVLIDAL